MATATTRRPPQQQQRQGSNSNGQANRPFHVIRGRGGLKVVIWENNTQNGPMFSIQLLRVYKDGENWHETGSVNRDDLLTASKLLDQADTVIQREEEKRREQRSENERD